MAQATLNGYLLNDGGEPCTVWFDWGLTIAYGQITPFMHGMRTGAQFSYTLTGLSEGTVYHYRAIVQNTQFVVYGADVWFVTPEREKIMTLMPQELEFILEQG